MSATNTFTLSKVPKTIIGFFKNTDEIESYLDDEISGLINTRNSVVIILKGINEINIVKYFLLQNGHSVNEIRPITNFEIKNDAINLGVLSHTKDLTFDYVIIIDLADDKANNESKNINAFHLSKESYSHYKSMANTSLYLLSSGNPAKYLSEIADEEIIEKIGSPEDPTTMCLNYNIFPMLDMNPDLSIEP